MQNENEIRITLRLGALRSLMGLPTPNLRGITLGWNTDAKTICIRSYFDQKPCQVEKELLSTFATEIASDFSELWLLKEEVIHLPAPQKMEMLKEWIYIRYEGELGPLSEEK